MKKLILLSYLIFQGCATTNPLKVNCKIYELTNQGVVVYVCHDDPALYRNEQRK